MTDLDAVEDLASHHTTAEDENNKTFSIWDSAAERNIMLKVSDTAPTKRMDSLYEYLASVSRQYSFRPTSQQWLRGRLTLCDLKSRATRPKLPFRTAMKATGTKVAIADKMTLGGDGTIRVMTAEQRAKRLKAKQAELQKRQSMMQRRQSQIQSLLRSESTIRAARDAARRSELATLKRYQIRSVEQTRAAVKSIRDSDEKRRERERVRQDKSIKTEGGLNAIGEEEGLASKVAQLRQEAGAATSSTKTEGSGDVGTSTIDGIKEEEEDESEDSDASEDDHEEFGTRSEQPMKALPDTLERPATLNVEAFLDMTRLRQRLRNYVEVCSMQTFLELEFLEGVRKWQEDYFNPDGDEISDSDDDSDDSDDDNNDDAGGGRQHQAMLTEARRLYDTYLNPETAMEPLICDNDRLRDLRKILKIPTSTSTSSTTMTSFRHRMNNAIFKASPYFGRSQRWLLQKYQKYQQLPSSTDGNDADSTEKQKKRDETLRSMFVDVKRFQEIQLLCNTYKMSDAEVESSEPPPPVPSFCTSTGGRDDHKIRSSLFVDVVKQITLVIKCTIYPWFLVSREYQHIYQWWLRRDEVKAMMEAEKRAEQKRKAEEAKAAIAAAEEAAAEAKRQEEAALNADTLDEEASRREASKIQAALSDHAIYLGKPRARPWHWNDIYVHRNEHVKATQHIPHISLHIDINTITSNCESPVPVIDLNVDGKAKPKFYCLISVDSRTFQTRTTSSGTYQHHFEFPIQITSQYVEISVWHASGSCAGYTIIPIAALRHQYFKSCEFMSKEELDAMHANHQRPSPLDESSSLSKNAHLDSVKDKNQPKSRKSVKSPTHADDDFKCRMKPMYVACRPPPQDGEGLQAVVSVASIKEPMDLIANQSRMLSSDGSPVTGSLVSPTVRQAAKGKRITSGSGAPLHINIAVEFSHHKHRDSRHIRLKYESAGKMALYVKDKVSKKKKRWKQDGFDLDLSYITPNIIAMGYPSSGREGIYRNDMKDVQEFFRRRHPHAYRVYNLCSERRYDVRCFDENSCIRYPFDDHNPCPFALLERFCRDVRDHLEEHPQNVAAIHCKAGKGRTGLMITVLLQYLNRVPSSYVALDQYAAARTKNHKGVTIPSQIRYVHYFGDYMMMRRRQLAPVGRTGMILSKIIMRGLPTGVKTGSTVFFTVKFPRLRPVSKEQQTTQNSVLYMPNHNHLNVSGTSELSTSGVDEQKQGGGGVDDIGEDEDEDVDDGETDEMRCIMDGTCCVGMHVCGADELRQRVPPFTSITAVPCNIDEKKRIIVWDLSTRLFYVSEDIHIIFYVKKSLGKKKKLFQMHFNTRYQKLRRMEECHDASIRFQGIPDSSRYMFLEKKYLDTAHKDVKHNKKFPTDFGVYFFFESTHLSEYCKTMELEDTTAETYTPPSILAKTKHVGLLVEREHNARLEAQKQQEELDKFCVTEEPSAEESVTNRGSVSASQMPEASMAPSLSRQEDVWSFSEIMKHQQLVILVQQLAHKVFCVEYVFFWSAVTAFKTLVTENTKKANKVANVDGTEEWKAGQEIYTKFIQDMSPYQLGIIEAEQQRPYIAMFDPDPDVAADALAAMSGDGKKKKDKKEKKDKKVKKDKKEKKEKKEKKDKKRESDVGSLYIGDLNIMDDTEEKSNTTGKGAGMESYIALALQERLALFSPLMTMAEQQIDETLMEEIQQDPGYLKYRKYGTYS